jgi:glycosyltransferase involved in cell wall biosynthesis
MPTASSESQEGPLGLLRLLIIFHEAQSLGAGTSVVRSLPYLEAFGWTTSAWFGRRGPLAEGKYEGIARSHVHECPLAFSLDGWREQPGVVSRAARTPNYLRQFARVLEQTRPHVVHANTLLALPEALVARSRGLPVVFHVHEMPAAGAKRNTAIRLAARAADVLVGVSHAVTGMLRERSGGTPVLTVHNGTPILGDTTRERVDRTFTVGTVATVSRIKGTDTFLRAARAALAERPDLRFEHVGAPDLHRDRGLDDELQAIVHTDSVELRIAMLGSRPAATVMPNWDMFVLASSSEGFPLVTLEAMALGLPVIATTVGGVPEQIEHLRTGILVRPGDPEALATWIVRLRNDEALRRRLGAAAQERVRSVFTVESQAEGMHRAYLTALNRRFGPPSVRRRARIAT